MSIDYDSYVNMEQKDLEKMVVHIKNILNLREQKVLDAIEKRDLIELKKALEHNSEKRLSDKAWKEVNFSHPILSEKDLDFFLFIRDLPNYEKHDVTSGRLTKTEEAVYSGFFNKKLFDFFINHNDFSPIVKK